MIIYKVTNAVNGKVYIGQTTQTLEKRWKNHLHDMKYNTNNKFYNAIKKYGCESFIKEVIEENIQSEEKLSNREKYWIKYYNSYKEGYNSTIGGEISPMKYKEIREKVSKSMKGRKFTKEHREKLKLAQKGRKGTPHTEEHKKYMSQLMKGREVSKETREKLRKASLGQKQSDETINKRSKAMKGRKFTKEHREKISKSLKGNSNVMIGKDNPRSKPIVQVDKTTGEIIRMYESANLAAKALNKKSSGDITNCANGVKVKSAYGYKWIWCDVNG